MAANAARKAPWRLRLVRILSNLVGLACGLAGHQAARAVDVPADKAEALFHVYKGGGVTATGPALLVRKSLADKVSLSGQYYVDMVSNASIDVVTTASPFREKRTALDLGLDYVVRDTTISVTRANSREPDYTADSLSVDLAQEVFGNMSTVSLGFTRGWDKVGRVREGFFDVARHWRYRLGLTQVLTPRWIASVNFEAVSDDGYLGNPYRVARVFGAAVAERYPRTRSSRALSFRAVGDLGSRDAMRVEYRYFWDNWDIKAHTLEAGYSRYIGERWMADTYVRLHSQSSALFYSDNASVDSLYVSRNRQLSDFVSPSMGAKASYTMKQALRGHDVKLNGGVEFKRFSFNNFTDIRTGQPYAHYAALLQLYVTANF